MGRLEGKTALVTGAARGTGAAIARLFAEEGARVMLSDVRDESGRAIVAEIGDAATYRHLDVRREDEWSAAVEALLADFGKLDILVNNAARLIIKSMLDTTAEDLLRLVEVNQLGPYLGIRAVTKPMRDAGGGSIVNVCSTDGVKGMNGVSAYASTKWALRGITKAAAMELARDGIRVNAVCPGFTRTAIVAAARATIAPKTGRSAAEAEAALDAAAAEAGFAISTIVVEVIGRCPACRESEA